MQKIAPMTRVTLTFTAGTYPEATDIPLEKSGFEFIFGIGSGGLTPFEYELDGKTIGDEIGFRLHSVDAKSFFGHLHPPVAGLVPDRPELFVKARIQGIDTADSRQVIKALAEMAQHAGGGCGCGGSCGCG